MNKGRARFWMAVYAIVGSTIGVGIFSLPYVIAQAGPWLGLLWMFGVAVLNVMALQMYAEVVMFTPGRSRLPGLARRYLGEHMAPIVGFFGFMHGWGAMLSYIVIGGFFLHSLASFFINLPIVVFQAAFAGLMSLILLGGLGFVSWIEKYMVAVLAIVFLVMIVAGIPHMEFAHLLAPGSPGVWFLPFGPLLFAFSGFSAIPEAADLLRQDRGRLRDVIFTSSALITFFYVAFIVVAIAIAGPDITTEAIQGIAAEMGDWFLILGSIMGLAAVSTSFILIGISITDSLVYDFQFRHLPAWALTAVVPSFFFILGARDFLTIVSITGGVLGGLTGLLVLWIYTKARVDMCLPKRCLSIPRSVIFVVGLAYLVGIGLELFLR